MTEPYYKDDLITIYHGDCADIVPELGRFDLLLTDIPYGEVNRDSNGLRNLNKGVADLETHPIKRVAEMLSGIASSAYAFCGTAPTRSLR